MSLAIALDNNPEIITRLDNLRNILDVFKNIVPEGTSLNNTDMIVDHQIIDDLYEWIDDIYKILTDYELFSEGNLNDE